jgi:signal transduction histidine kinase/DNA-binding NarL/FixJ family response regulator
MEAGDYTVAVPVHRSDEIGYLTGAFNNLVARLGDMIHTLETRVTERTRDLHQANEDLLQTNSRLLAEIAEREEAQAQVIEQQRIMAALEERERLGRDLHDGLGQVMGYLNVQAQAVHTQLNDGHLDSARHNLLDLSTAAQEAHRDIRAHILGLRPAETPRQDFLTTVNNYIQQFSRHYHLPATFNVPPDFSPTPFTPAVEEQALRLLQEGLTNIRRHARAGAVTVSFRQSGGAVELEIVDDGIGFDPAATPEGHFGLEIMRERVGQAGGSLALVTAPGQGTRLVVNLPLAMLPQSGDDLADIRGLRLLLVDDHPLFLDGLRNLLLARGLTVIGLANSGPEAVQKTRDLRPDVVVMDMNMPGGDGLPATRAIKAEFPAVKVVILTMAEDDDAMYQAIESGAAGFLLKNMEANQFCELLTGLMRDEAALDPRLTGRLLSKFAEMSAAPSLLSADEAQLIEQQWEILGLVAAGMTYKEVATQLNLSYKTIQYHMAQILEKLGLKNRAQAIAWYQQQHPPA